MEVPGGFGLYVHWPFCLSKCPYCDFNSHVGEAVDQGRWRRALLRELAQMAQELPTRRRLDGIYFGGGTPSLMDPDSVEAIIDDACRLFESAPDLEITLEANPSAAETQRLVDFRQAGVNRLSLGVQSLDDETLDWLGRSHDAQAAMDALETARRFFPSYSFDLIYALPGQGGRQWRADLGQALEWVGDHLSVYQLTIERGTQLYRDGVQAADEETAALLYEDTQEMLEEAGFPAYEISNHARPGAESRHNLIYWRGGEYLGIGPGAHGRLRGDGVCVVERRLPAPEAWLRRVEETGHGTLERTVLTTEAHQRDLLMSGLRLVDGVDRDLFSVLAGADPLSVIDGSAARDLEDGGYLEITETVLRATSAGRQRLNAVLAALLI